MIAFCTNCRKNTAFDFELQSGAHCCSICGQELSIQAPIVSTPVIPPPPAPTPVAPSHAKSHQVPSVGKAAGNKMECHGCYALQQALGRIKALEEVIKKTRRRTGRRRITI